MRILLALMVLLCGAASADAAEPEKVLFTLFLCTELHGCEVISDRHTAEECQRARDSFIKVVPTWGQPYTKCEPDVAVGEQGNTRSAK